MSEHNYAVIMAGGGGTRLWPLSRQARPKQMLALFDQRSLFQIAVDRLEGLFPPERVLVVTVASQAAELQAQYPQIPAENYLLEPQPRGTASVVGLAAVALQHIDPQAVMTVLTADHFIADTARFRHLLHAASDMARQGYLVTLGIEPTYPATGFGYIQRGELLGQASGLDVFAVRRFKEKPALETARQMLESGDHSWNSGMFVWQVATIQAEIRRQMPALDAALHEISASWNTPQRQEVLQRVWLSIQPQTIDFGVMEGAQRVAVIPAAGLGWNDVGSWESLYEVLPPDEQGNIAISDDFLGLDTRGTLVYSRQAQRKVVTIDVQDLVIVDTGDVLLVCHRNAAQRVRQVVNMLKESGQDDLL